MTEEEFKVSKKSKKATPSSAALKDFHLFMPPTFDIQIKEGDDLSELNLSDALYKNLKTEKVMKG